MAGQVSRGVCRIIAGKWRGRKIKFEDAEGLRPTTDRIRETVFSWLQSYLPRSKCLDCFAGSGVLGFEALSRGAQEVVFLEKNSRTVKWLQENVRSLEADNVAIHHQDALSWLRSASTDMDLSHKFDLVFLDPPFQSDLLAKASALLDRSGCLVEDAIIYVENAVDADIVLPDNWVCLKQKNSGQVSYKLYQYKIINSVANPRALQK